MNIASLEVITATPEVVAKAKSVIEKTGANSSFYSIVGRYDRETEKQIIPERGTFQVVAGKDNDVKKPWISHQSPGNFKVANVLGKPARHMEIGTTIDSERFVLVEAVATRRYQSPDGKTTINQGDERIFYVLAN